METDYEIAVNESYQVELDSNPTTIGYFANRQNRKTLNLEIINDGNSYFKNSGKR